MFAFGNWNLLGEFPNHGIKLIMYGTILEMFYISLNHYSIYTLKKALFAILRSKKLWKENFKHTTTQKAKFLNTHFFEVFGNYCPTEWNIGRSDYFDSYSTDLYKFPPVYKLHVLCSLMKSLPTSLFWIVRSVVSHRSGYRIFLHLFWFVLFAFVINVLLFSLSINIIEKALNVFS